MAILSLILSRDPYSSSFSDATNHHARLRMSSVTQIAPEVPPLTRIFTPSPDCTNPSAYTSSLWANNQYAYQLDSGVSKYSCYPTKYSSLQIDKSSYYSPGVCPLSYEYVATSTARGPAENAAVATYTVCCPPGLHTWAINSAARRR